MGNKNNLVCINIGEEKLFFTTPGKAGLYLGLQYNSVMWAINHKNKLITKDDRVCTVKIVDGSDIPYKYIDKY